MIPQKLQMQGVRFVLLEKGGKKPFQQGWQNKTISFSDNELIEHIKNGGNYGVMGGGEKKLLIVDFDNLRIQEELVPKLPPTFTVRAGRGLLHKYYLSDKADSFKIFNEEMDTLLDVQGEGKQVVGAGSLHPNGNRYQIVEDIDIAFIPYSELLAIIKPYDKKPKKEKIEIEKPTEYSHDSFMDIAKSRIKMTDLLNKFGIDTSRNPTQCPLHHSNGGKCLGFKDEVAHCFHCEGSWNIFSLVKEVKNYDFKQALEWLADNFGLREEYDAGRREYLAYLNSSERNEKSELKSRFLKLIKDEKTSEASEIIVEYILKHNHIYTTKDDNKSEIWIYDNGIYVPQGRSEIKHIMREILEEWFNAYYFNLVINKIEPDTYVDQSTFFRINYPHEVPVRNGILNIFTRQLVPFTPDKIFFNKLPIIYDPKAICPAIDLFLNEVLASQDDKLVFYELAGFALMKEYRYEKAAMFVGNGRNGKGKSLELLKRMVGAENCSSIPLSGLTPDSFNISELFGKLLNLAGDIGNKDLEDTSMFKTLTGRDLVTTKRKFLTGLSFENYAKFIFACNDLPSVYDTSRGFWDRWVLLEFPYTFVTEEEFERSTDKTKLKIKDENIISKIVTPNELSGLLNQALDGLNRLVKHHNFSQTIGTREIKEFWIRKANSVVGFIFDHVEEDTERYISKKEFRKRYSEYCKKHMVISKSDYVIKKALQEMFGASDEKVKLGSYPNEEWQWVWQGVKWKF